MGRQTGRQMPFPKFSFFFLFNFLDKVDSSVLIQSEPPASLWLNSFTRSGLKHFLTALAIDMNFFSTGLLLLHLSVVVE